MSHIRHATVSLERGITFSFEALVSSSIIDTISKAAGSMRSSAIVCGFLHIYATLNDAMVALQFTAVAFTKLCSC